MSNYRDIFALALVASCVVQLSAATTKSWQHPDAIKQLETSRASVPAKKIKISDKLGHIDAVQPTQSAMGGFENHSATRKKSSPVVVATVNNKLDKIQSGKAFVGLEENLPRYDIGPGVNLTLDVAREIVNVNLDEDYMKDVFRGRGRRNWDLIMKIIPLFIIPFLIQSAIIPFMVSAVKLLLVKTLVIGKSALLLLGFTALKNMYKHANQVYEVPLYNYDGPMRRYEQPPNTFKYDPVAPTQWGT